VHAGAALAAAPQGEAPRTAAEAAVLKLPNGEAAHWRQPLLQALGERLQVELGRGSERAVIRLDPPMMGSIEIVIRHEGGALQVQLSATHGEVLRQLQALGDSLRQELVHRQYAEVSVQVSDGSRDADGRQRQRQQDEAAPGRALAEAEGEQGRAAFALAPDQE
jgi:flagellar hook-length control protein FliK